jgi:cytochrome c553
MKKLLVLLALASCVGVAAAETPAGSSAVPREKLEQCIGCHGIPDYKGTFPEVYRVPMIGGQSAKYIEAALTAYRKGDRKHPSMNGIAKSLSDQEIAALAAFYSQQGSK